jgi:hypothetical protein
MVGCSSFLDKLLKTDLAGEKRTVWAFVGNHTSLFPARLALELSFHLFFVPKVGVEAGGLLLGLCHSVQQQPAFLLCFLLQSGLCILCSLLLFLLALLGFDLGLTCRLGFFVSTSLLLSNLPHISLLPLSSLLGFLSHAVEVIGTLSRVWTTTEESRSKEIFEREVLVSAGIPVAKLTAAAISASCLGQGLGVGCLI